MKASLELTLLSQKPHCFYVNDVVLMLISRNLHVFVLIMTLAKRRNVAYKLLIRFYEMFYRNSFFRALFILCCFDGSFSPAMSQHTEEGKLRPSFPLEFLVDKH